VAAGGEVVIAGAATVAAVAVGAEVAEVTVVVAGDGSPKIY